MTKFPNDSIKLHKLGEECAVFGIYSLDGENCASDAYYALLAMQHRGQESCGIVASNHGSLIVHKDMGLVQDVFSPKVLETIQGELAIGHVRYSTCGSSVKENAQPLTAQYGGRFMAVAHNGNLTNALALRQQLESEYILFQTTVDSEAIAYLLAREDMKCHSLEQAVASVMDQLEGAFSLVVMSSEKLIAVRDPHGFRPLCLGRRGNTYIVASETCALDILGAEFLRDIEPGEVLLIDKTGLHQICHKPAPQKGVCIFEYIYFARPDSTIDGVNVQVSREIAGRILARAHPVEADIVTGVPDSGIGAAIGFAAESGIPYDTAFVKNKYIARTFIAPEQRLREQAVRIKLNPIRHKVEGKRVVMVDDSIVRGTTGTRIVKLLKDAGAKEVHVRIASPPFRFPCYFGTDIPDTQYLTANLYDIEGIRKLLGADSLGYLPLEALPQLIGSSGFCSGCFTGKYPIDIQDQNIQCPCP